jgi:phenylpyruvate tautomerase PptA (4-oxalocrotonate tautomerase family)
VNKLPVLIYEGPEISPPQRKELIKGLTEAAIKVTPEIQKEVYYVFLREHSNDKIGLGGCILPEYLDKLQKMRDK